MCAGVDRPVRIRSSRSTFPRASLRIVTTLPVKIRSRFARARTRLRAPAYRCGDTPRGIRRAKVGDGVGWSAMTMDTGWAWVFGGLIIAGLVLLGIVLARVIGGGITPGRLPGTAPEEPSAVEQLAQRYARG